MPEQPTHRRLAAILAADVVGYSRMMDADETGTLAALKRHRESVFDPTVAGYGGRIVKLMGDGTLVEFASVVDAVNCAIAIQRAKKADSAAGAEGIVLRIGINLGDVIIEGDDIYGDGVNVAARLEPLAEPGGVCISGTVNESVGNRITEAFSDSGEVTVKNISRPIRIWKWHPDGQTTDRPTSSQSTSRSSETDRPSIAVLPFSNMSGNHEEDYFADGITEDIITDLSKVIGLLVIARNSSFAYKEKSVDIRTIGRELNVKSVLEGSIRRTGGRIRITAQLVDAVSGGHLWAERYDRELTDIFELQDEVTGHIVEALKVRLSPAEASRIANIPTSSVEAHDHFLRGRELLLGQKKDRQMFDQVVAYLRRAIELDPNYAEPHAGLAMAHCLDFQNGWTGAPDALDLAVHFSELGIEKGPSEPYVHYIAAVIVFWTGDLGKTKHEAELALALNPNYALAYGVRGLADIYAGAPLAAVPYIERAIRLDPAFTQQYLHFLGSAYLVAGKYEEAAVSFLKRIRLSPQTDLSRGLLVSALGHLGKVDEAQRVWAELHHVNPNYSFDRHIARLPFSNSADADRIRAGLAKAGL